DEFKGAWRAIGRIAPERLSGLRRVATIESVGSSTRIEGAKLDNREVERLLSNLRAHTLATRDEQEVAGYAEVMDTIFAHWDAIPLTENHIKQLHPICWFIPPRTSGIGAPTRPCPVTSKPSTRTEKVSALFSRRRPRSTRHA